MGDNFRIYSMQDWDGAIKSMKQARDYMEQAGKKMREIVANALTTTGFTGDIAQTLMTAYDNDVLILVKQFLAAVDDFVARNEKMVGRSEDVMGKIDSRVKTMKVESKINLNNNLDVKNTGVNKKVTSVAVKDKQKPKVQSVAVKNSTSKNKSGITKDKVDKVSGTNKIYNQTFSTSASGSGVKKISSSTKVTNSNSSFGIRQSVSSNINLNNNQHKIAQAAGLADYQTKPSASSTTSVAVKENSATAVSGTNKIYNQTFSTSASGSGSQKVSSSTNVTNTNSSFGIRQSVSSNMNLNNNQHKIAQAAERASYQNMSNNTSTIGMAVKESSSSNVSGTNKILQTIQGESGVRKVPTSSSGNNSETTKILSSYISTYNGNMNEDSNRNV